MLLNVGNEITYLLLLYNGSDKLFNGVNRIYVSTNMYANKLFFLIECVNHITKL